jgi:Restriction endonuclease
MTNFEPRFCRSFQDFENAARDWMVNWGFLDAFTTSIGKDGGVDIESDQAVAQVKATTKPTGRPHVQRLKGVAFDGRQAFFFSLGGYTNEARVYADEAAVRLFRFSGYDGKVEPINKAANEFIRLLDDLHTQKNASLSLTHRVALACKERIDEDAIERIVNKIMASIEGVSVKDGFIVFEVDKLACRYVQCANSIRHLESVGINWADPPITIGQMNTLRELGWKKGRNKGVNFELTMKLNAQLFEIIECIALTLINVHNLTNEKELIVTIGKWE